MQVLRLRKSTLLGVSVFEPFREVVNLRFDDLEKGEVLQIGRDRFYGLNGSNTSSKD
jgi:hypothetical protein